jgi:hypothetical protein
MRSAIGWWRGYLSLGKKSLYQVDRSLREHVRLWTDASGADRWLAGVLETQGRWYWTNYRVPDELWDLFNERNDDQIGMQELLAIPLAYETFKGLMRGKLATIYIDNVGAMSCLIKGSSRASDINSSIGYIWKDLVILGIGAHFTRVESKANVSDGPTRSRFEVLHRLAAERIEPVEPSWFKQLNVFPCSVYE